MGRDMLKKGEEETMTAMHRNLQMARADHVVEIGGRYINVAHSDARRIRESYATLGSFTSTDAYGHCM